MATPNERDRSRAPDRYTQGSELINAPSPPKPDPPSSVESSYYHPGYYQPEPVSFTAPPIPFPSPMPIGGSLPSLPSSAHTHFPRFEHPAVHQDSPLIDVATLNNTNGAFTGGNTTVNGNGNRQPQQSAPQFGIFQSFATADPSVRSLPSATTFDFSASTTPSQLLRNQESDREVERIRNLPLLELQREANRQEQLVRERQREANRQEQFTEQQQQENARLEQERRHQDFLAAFTAARSREPEGDNLSRRSTRSQASSLGSRHSD